jgi:orotate phosphoribosyltransferase
VVRNYVHDEFSKKTSNNLKPDVIAGESKYMLLVLLVAEHVGLPFVYVRPEPKKNMAGQNQVEGFTKKGQT